MTKKYYTYYIGWDVGGAHLKAALLNSSGLLLNVCQFPCPLWKGLNHLADATRSIMASFKLDPALIEAVFHGVTMTGE